MPDAHERLTSALSDRYLLERELAQGGIARRRVAKATARLMSLKRQVPGFRGHFSDLSRVAASAADSRADSGADSRAASAADTGAHPDA